MHFEVPKAKTFKEFGGEYLMIVISILTALALEHAVQTVHHRHLAHEATQKIEAELRINRKELAEVLEHNEGDVQRIRKTGQELLQAIRNKTSDDVLMARFHAEWKPALVLSIKVPTLRREAWEAALANQAVTWMPSEQVERYASAYANIRDVQLLSTGGSIGFLDGPRMRDTMSDVQMGTATPRDMFRVLNQMLSAYGSIDGNLDGLQKVLGKAVGADPAAHWRD
jgi:hypothetical protein